MARSWNARLTSAVAGVVVVSLASVGLTAVPAAAATGDERENLQMVQSVQAPRFAVAPDQIPVRDSVVGRGIPLGDDPAQRIDLGSLARAHSSALVRVTVQEPSADATVRTAGTTDVLFAPAGVTTSTTLLLPVTGGEISLSADRADVPVRVEALAFMGGLENSPGATIALAEPVLRADTTVSHGGAQLSTTRIWFGVTGDGGVSTEARSVYVSLDVTVATDDVLFLGDGQQLALPAGRSIVTTVVDADVQGGVSAALRSGTGDLRASVLGWVVEAVEGASKANFRGSYVLSTENRAPVSGRATPDAPLSLDAADHGDIDYALVLVSATAGTRADTTTLAWEHPLSGRASGVAVDREAASAPQLALVPVDQDEASVAPRRGAATLTVQTLGGFLGDPEQEQGGEAATITITAPRDLDSLDISNTGFFRIEGVVTAGPNAVDRVEISSPSVGFIANAELDYDGEKITWSLRTLAPEDGDFTYVARVFDRADPTRARDEDEVRITLDVADADDEVVSPDVRTYNLDPANPEFRAIDENTVAFVSRPDLEPGQILVSGPVVGAESGLFARVSHLDVIDGEWVVSLTDAELNDAFFQTDIDETIEYGEDSPIQVTDLLATAADPDTLIEGTYAPVSADGTVGPEVSVDDYEIAQGSSAMTAGTNAELRTGEDVDLTLGADDFDIDPADFETQCRPAGSDGQEPVGEEIDENGEWHPTGNLTASPSTACPSSRLGIDLHGTWSTGLDANILFGLENGKAKVINATHLEPWEFEAAQARQLDTRAAIGITAGGEVTLSLDFVLKVKMDLKWAVWKSKITIVEFTNVVTSTFKANASLRAFFEAEGKLNFRLDVAEVALPTSVFVVLGVPIAITNRLNFAIAVTGKLKAEVAIPAVGLERVDRFGFTYSSAKGIERVKNDTPTKYVTPSLKTLGSSTKISLEGGIAVGPEGTYRSRIYSFAGPDLGVSAQAGVEGKAATTLLPPREVEAEVQVYLAIGITGQVKLTLLKWDLVNLKLFAIGVRLNLFTKKWKFTL
ncbi:hypothetical protein ACWIBQ_07400 [Microbacterium keratanolyticum]